MSQKRIAIYGGSFNPPGAHHVSVVQSLSRLFDRVIVVPCGPRPDKEITNDIHPSHRAAMADLAFQDIPNVEVDLFDLENETFTTNMVLQQRYSDEGHVHHVVGADLTGTAQECAILESWHRGGELWESSRFVVIERADHPVAEDHLPRQTTRLSVGASGSSTEIRKRIFARESFEDLVPSRVATYIRRYGLYRMSIPSDASHLSIDDPIFSYFRDERNAEAVRLSKSVTLPWSMNSNLIMVFGGDGTMLRAIKSEWRKRVPFYGVNLGHVGFLLNAYDGNPFTEESFKNLVVHRVPLLSVEMEMLDGKIVHELAFNDAYVQNVDQAVWVKISTNDVVRVRRMVADTVLVSSPAGSTAYARAMGATPMLLEQKGLVLAGSAVNEPLGWHSVHLPESTIVFEALDSEKRPAIGKVDGKSFGPVRKMTIRTSRTAAAELAFLSDADLNEKRIASQFPKR